MKRKGELPDLPLFDYNRCTFCGKCIDICPKEALSLENDTIDVDADKCMLCAHCFSVCRAGAVDFKYLRAPSFKSFRYSERLMPPGKQNPGDMVNFVRSRRSVRKYTDKALNEEILRDLVEFAVTAPSGSNCQVWEFIIINGRERVFGLAQDIRAFFIKLNNLVRNPISRYLSLIYAGWKLIRYYKNNFQSVERGLKEAEKGGDLLFHGAPALIIIHGPLGGSTPVEDAQYAAYNITLLAHALGLGTCFIGYAVESINRVKGLKKKLGIPGKNRVHAVLTLGYPSVGFHSQALRKPYGIQWF